MTLETLETLETGVLGGGFSQAFISNWKKENFKRKISPSRCGESGIKVS